MKDATPPASAAVTDADLESSVRAAQEGSRAALERAIRAVQDDVYGLALRFLWHPQDAEDATQEVLVRVVTRLAGFRGESSFRTWVYRVAVNTLLNTRRGRMEAAGHTFSSFGADLDDWPAVEPFVPPPDVEHAILMEEVRVGCTLGMLLCLDRPHRLAYILGEILALDHKEAATVLEITPAAYRQRLSRARRSIVDFLRDKCGLVAPKNRCRCGDRVPIAIARGRVDPSAPLHAGDGSTATSFPDTLETIRALEEARRAVALYRAQPEPRAPASLTTLVRTIVRDEIGRAGSQTPTPR